MLTSGRRIPILFLVGCTLWGCAATGQRGDAPAASSFQEGSSSDGPAEEGDSEAGAESTALTELERRMKLEAIAPEFMALFEALREAVRAREDRTARALLARLYARQPEGQALELAKGFERILDGRELLSQLTISLQTRAPETVGEPYFLELDLASTCETDLVFRPGPATLHLMQTAVDSSGAERRNSRTSTSDELLDITVPAGETVRVGLLNFEAPLRLSSFHVAPELMMTRTEFSIRNEDTSEDAVAQGEVLAARYAFELDMRAGAVLQEDRVYPAYRVPIEGAERVWLSQTLPDELQSPERFLEAALSTEARSDRLLRSAVRIPREERQETLEAIARRVDDLTLPALEIMAPSLRWLAVDSHSGGAPSVWSSYLRDLRDATNGERSGRDSAPVSGRGLDLPLSR